MYLQPRFSVLDRDAQFFVQLTVQRRCDGFTLFHLAAGKLPQSPLMNVIRSAGNQHLVRRVDQDANGDMNRTHVRYSALMRT